MNIFSFKSSNTLKLNCIFFIISDFLIIAIDCHWLRNNIWNKDKTILDVFKHS